MQHRKKVQFHQSFLIIYMLFCVLAAQKANAQNSNSSSTTTNTTVKSKDDDAEIEQFEKQVFDLINAYRTKNKLQPLEWSNAVYDACLTHSINMAQKKAPFNHDGFEKRVASIDSALMLKRPLYLAASAENLAFGVLTPEKVTAGWIKSPGHRKNLSGNYTHSAVAIETDEQGVMYFTQIFIRIQ